MQIYEEKNALFRWKSNFAMEKRLENCDMKKCDEKHGFIFSELFIGFIVKTVAFCMINNSVTSSRVGIGTEANAWISAGFWMQANFWIAITDI